jgi:SAM-dependent methyltransferase
MAERIIGLYQDGAHAWDRKRGRQLFEKSWLDRFLSGLPQPAEILDIGCGSGEPLAKYLIDQGHHVTGVDSAPAMIDLCQARFSGQTWMVADMRQLSLPKTVDGLLAWDSFFHLSFADQRGMFPVFARHAKSGTALLFTTGPSHGEAIGEFEGEPLYHASLDEAEYRALLDRSGFEVVAYVPEDPDCGRHTVWLARAR